MKVWITRAGVDRPNRRAVLQVTALDGREIGRVVAYVQGAILTDAKFGRVDDAAGIVGEWDPADEDVALDCDGPAGSQALAWPSAFNQEHPFRALMGGSWLPVSGAEEVWLSGRGGCMLGPVPIA